MLQQQQARQLRPVKARGRHQRQLAPAFQDAAHDYGDDADGPQQEPHPPERQKHRQVRVLHLAELGQRLGGRLHLHAQIPQIPPQGLGHRLLLPARGFDQEVTGAADRRVEPPEVAFTDKQLAREEAPRQQTVETQPHGQARRLRAIELAQAGVQCPHDAIGVAKGRHHAVAHRLHKLPPVAPAGEAEAAAVDELWRHAQQPGRVGPRQVQATDVLAGALQQRHDLALRQQRLVVAAKAEIAAAFRRRQIVRQRHGRGRDEGKAAAAGMAVARVEPGQVAGVGGHGHDHEGGGGQQADDQQAARGIRPGIAPGEAPQAVAQRALETPAEPQPQTEQRRKQQQQANQEEGDDAADGNSQ